jgi:hypothetical protein
MVGITLYDPANWTDDTFEIFSYCFDIVARGCDSSATLEKEIRRKFWWVSQNMSYTLVWAWFRNKEQLVGLLNNWRVNDPENSSHATTRSSRNSEGSSEASESSGTPCASPP